MNLKTCTPCFDGRSPARRWVSVHGCDRGTLAAETSRADRITGSRGEWGLPFERRAARTPFKTRNA